jgi:hypothetical protein
MLSVPQELVQSQPNSVFLYLDGPLRNIQRKIFHMRVKSNRNVLSCHRNAPSGYTQRYAFRTAGKYSKANRNLLSCSRTTPSRKSQRTKTNSFSAARNALKQTEVCLHAIGRPFWDTLRKTNICFQYRGKTLQSKPKSAFLLPGSPLGKHSEKSKASPFSSANGVLKHTEICLHAIGPPLEEIL